MTISACLIINKNDNKLKTMYMYVCHCNIWLQKDSTRPLLKKLNRHFYKKLKNNFKNITLLYFTNSSLGTVNIL